MAVDVSQWTPFNQQGVSESIYFNGVEWQGAFTYRVDRVETYKVDTPEGVTGSTVKYLGREEREIQIEATITTADEYVRWMQITEVVFSPPARGTRSRAVAISHPELNRYYGINAVNLIRASNPQPDGTLTRRKATMTLREQSPPRVTESKVGGANPDNQKQDDPQLSPENQARAAATAANLAEAGELQARTNKLDELHRGDVNKSASINP